MNAANRPRLLDLFCGAGGAAMGYHLAGFNVVGVDKLPQPNYPFEFIQGDALEFAEEHGHEFDVRHASPPCQKWCVIENVEYARSELVYPVMLCGSSFGLDVRRHRLFEISVPLLTPPCDHAWQTPRFPPATNRTNLRSTVEVGVYRIPLAVQQRAMGIDWMTLPELSQAIPPAYTEFIGRQLWSECLTGVEVA